jgi:hypothetical protein
MRAFRRSVLGLASLIHSFFQQPECLLKLRQEGPLLHGGLPQVLCGAPSFLRCYPEQLVGKASLFLAPPTRFFLISPYLSRPPITLAELALVFGLGPRLFCQLTCRLSRAADLLRNGPLIFRGALGCFLLLRVPRGIVHCEFPGL